MRISAKAEYACIAMLELACQHKSAQPVTVKAIAEAHGIPQRYLVQILLQLKGAGLVHSVRGAAGGYQLAVPPDKISLAEVMEVIDGPLPSRHEPAGSPRSPAVAALCRVWNQVLDKERHILHQVTFADLAESVRRNTADMYYI